MRGAVTAEEFICAIADLGDPETGNCDNWDESDILATMEAIIERARYFQRGIDHSRSILIFGLVKAEEGLRNRDKRTSALDAVRHALKNG